MKGLNNIPSQIDELLRDNPGAPSEYPVVIDHLNGKDIMTLFVEADPGMDRKILGANIGMTFKAKIGISISVKPVAIGELPRSEKKSTRIFDNRY